jgi:mannose-6-phosphate isomerase-like protein (cupin superfamily)
MTEPSLPAGTVDSAEVVLPAPAFDVTLSFFTGTLGFAVAMIHPADSPLVAVLAGHGLRVCLDRDASCAPGKLRLRMHAGHALAAGPRHITAPNGTVIEIVDADPPMVLPPLLDKLVVSRAADGLAWHAGRAGLLYRDLLPDRLGGRFIASHIGIPQGGPVPDYVHFHKIRFQMIYCRRGWVRVVYEDQGESFVMHAGDCVLQPPMIRHRVLESSDGLEVVEIACPASHETFADPALVLPDARVDAMRDFSGQRFVRHVAAGAAWMPWHVPGFAARDLGIGAATAGLAGARVVRADGAAATPVLRHGAEFLFLFALAGSATLECGGSHVLAPDDACAVPAGADFSLTACSADFECLEVTLPGDPGVSPR